MAAHRRASSGALSWYKIIGGWNGDGDIVACSYPAFSTLNEFTTACDPEVPLQLSAITVTS